MVSDNDAGAISILEKADSVMTLLGKVGEASASEIAAAVHEPVSSTYRLLNSLTALGWVDAGSQRGRYRLGLDVLQVGSLLEDRLDVRRSIFPVLQALRDRTRNTSFLCFRRGDKAVCVERIGGRDVQDLAMRLGDSYPLYQGAAPRAILSFLPEEEREALLKRLAKRRKAGKKAPPADRVRAQIEEARALGYTVSDADVTPGIMAFGAPIFNHRGELAGAISLSGLRERILASEQDVALEVLGAARDSSAALGYAPAAERAEPIALAKGGAR
ncbi:IclR family transcriptional regulator [Gulosibacter sp. 10]|uniref:IclR family transcriptional regulator n=1 Tax=Gulosibacter sp. 10 TaxID=1255570 RepID=UPI00097F6850|nr:IclR family transcriptional regulator [Gulosibacter sp. 10]SJM70127.1 Transcriptional regulator, IclR family [Gulosibacter sp. 10]